MKPDAASRRRAHRKVAFFLLLAATAFGQAAGTETSEADAGDRLARWVDRLPEVLDFSLPDFGSDEGIEVTARPHLGDLVNRDYLRVPIRFRAKWRGTEASAEVQTYFTHGLRNSTSSGFAGFQLGLKRDWPLRARPGTGFSTGINYSSPLSRPPDDITDGYRHTTPYVGATFPLSARWKLTGFSTLGADIITKSDLPSNFRKNELHGNALSLTLGAAREFSRFQLSLSVTHSNTSLMTDESSGVTTVRPGVLIPIERFFTSSIRLFPTLGADAVWGPDGQELGFSGKVRVEFDLVRR